MAPLGKQVIWLFLGDVPFPCSPNVLNAKQEEGDCSAYERRSPTISLEDGNRKAQEPEQQKSRGMPADHHHVALSCAPKNWYKLVLTSAQLFIGRMQSHKGL